MRAVRDKYKDWFDVDPETGEWTLKEGKYELIEYWGRRGLYEKDIAHNMGVSNETFIQWKKRCPELVEAVKRSREESIAIVEGKLFEACLEGSLEAIRYFLNNHDPKTYNFGRYRNEIQIKASEVEAKIDDGLICALNASAARIGTDGQPIADEPL